MKERAYLELKELILGEALEVNSFLSERRLAQQLGMSKTPIRLAVERLESEGFLAVSPQQGIVIRDLTLDEIVDYIDYRIALESFVIKQLSGKLAVSQVAALEDSVARQFAVMRSGRPGTQAKLVEMDREYHQMFCGFLGNRQIIAAVERQSDMLFRVANRIFRKHPERLEQSFEEHSEITAAVAQGSEARAVELITEHIAKIKQLMVS